LSGKGNDGVSTFDQGFGAVSLYATEVEGELEVG
jgi:hypothetical protein